MRRSTGTLLQESLTRVGYALLLWAFIALILLLATGVSLVVPALTPQALLAATHFLR